MCVHCSMHMRTLQCKATNFMSDWRPIIAACPRWRKETRAAKNGCSPDDLRGLRYSSNEQSMQPGLHQQRLLWLQAYLSWTCKLGLIRRIMGQQHTITYKSGNTQSVHTLEAALARQHAHL
jgi:hypothetical protein